MYRLEVKVHSRRRGGGSMVKGAAYRAGGRLAEAGDDALASAAYASGTAQEGAGEIHDFTRKRGVVAAEIHGPQDMPERFHDRGTLWRAVETSETRVNSRLSREFIVTVPRVLTTEQGIDLVRGWVNEQLVERGMVADVAWHVAKARDGERNFHAHVLTTTREVTEEGFGRKVRDWDRKELVPVWRASWQEHCNWALEQAGRAERVDHRSLAAQAKDALARRDLATLARVDREPQPKLGRAATQMTRKGQASERGHLAEAVAARNAARAALYERIGRLGERARDAFLAARERLGDVLKAAEQWRQEIGHGQGAGWLDRQRDAVATGAARQRQEREHGYER